MRILRIYPFLPPLQGGMEKHILRLTQEQRILGCEISVAFNQGDATGSADISVLEGISLRKVKPQLLRDLIFYFCLIIKLTGSNKCFDIVHVHGDWSAFLLGRLVAFLVRANKCIASIHGVARRGLWSFVYRFTLQGYAMVYATGSLDASFIKSLIACPVRWQHSGIDADFFNIEDKMNQSVDVICVGSLVSVKNFGLAIDIAAIMPEVSFQMVGDGPLRTVLEEDCRRKGLTNVVFSGHISPAALSRTLRSARIFLMTSLTEGTPTALLEAMACGLTIVTSRSNNYDDLLKPGQNGYVIEGFKATDYVLKIRELLNDGNLLNCISQHNRAQAINYSWPEVAKRITDWMKSDASTNNKFRD